MNKSCPAKVLGLLLLGLWSAPLQAHVGPHPSVHDTVAGVIERMKREMTTNELSSLTPQKVESFLTTQERAILATEHITFRVNMPVRVSVVRDVKLGDEPFWLRQRGFARTAVMVKEGSNTYDVWQKDFAAGWIGLGIHSLTGSGNHYFILLSPKTPDEKIKLTDLYPGQLRTTDFRAGVEPYIDQADTLSSVPPELEGQLLIRTDTDREEDARLVNLFRWTRYVASNKPDQVVLTWTEVPRTTQAIQWRTSAKTKRGYVQYQKKSDYLRFNPRQPARVKAQTTKLETPTLVTPLFDKYHVDMALQGHDHAYLRTYPLKAGQRVASLNEGTVYVISVSGMKMYSQPKHDYTEFGMTNVSAYEVLDIQISGNRLVYRAYDIDGKLRDELVIEK